MLEINPEIICQIIVRAREFQAQEGVVIPETSGSYATTNDEDWAMQTLATHADDATYHEMRTAINSLEPDQQVSLVALMWLGRGDFTAEEWQDAITEAQDQWTNRTAEYLIATPLVADYLEEGLSQLGYSCTE